MVGGGRVAIGNRKVTPNENHTYQTHQRKIKEADPAQHIALRIFYGIRKIGQTNIPRRIRALEKLMGNSAKGIEKIAWINRDYLPGRGMGATAIEMEIWCYRNCSQLKE